MHVLFVCSRNKRRSLTAESIYKNHDGLQVKSAGTEPSARIKLNAKMVLWADIIFVMEKRHKQRMCEQLPAETKDKRIVILDIPYEFNYMDSVLIEELKLTMADYLQ